MSVFLSPDLMPVTGGTYFPPDGKYGLIGFKPLLLAVAKEVQNMILTFHINILTSTRVEKIHIYNLSCLN